MTREMLIKNLFDKYTSNDDDDDDEDGDDDHQKMAMKTILNTEEIEYVY